MNDKRLVQAWLEQHPVQRLKREQGFFESWRNSDRFSACEEREQGFFEPWRGSASRWVGACEER